MHIMVTSFAWHNAAAPIGLRAQACANALVSKAPKQPLV
jgi:hypothetical protein